MGTAARSRSFAPAALVRDLADAGGLAIIDGRRVRGRRIPLGPAGELLGRAAALAGEWRTADPGRGLASSVPWRVDAGDFLPRLVPGARRDDPPVLVVPAGDRSGDTTVPVLAGILLSEAPGQARQLEHALTADRLTIAEVVLGPAPLVTALRAVRLLRHSRR